VSDNLRISFVGMQRDDVVLKAGESATIGRAPDARLRLDAAQVSSRHASVMGVDGRWMLVDQGSRNGTLLNGTLVPAQVPCELAHGDVVQIHPFQMRMDLGRKSAASLTTLTAEDDRANVRAIDPAELESLAGRRLQLLIDSASMLHGAADLQALCAGAVEGLLAGTGFGRVLLLRIAPGGAVEVLASRQRDPSADPPRVSRSLLRAAGEGRAVRLEESNLNMAESIVGAGVTAAMCIPLMVGETIEGFAYLDSVGGARPGEDAAAFAQAFARFLAMGLGDIRRQELTERKRSLEKELAGAHDVQRRLMPEERGALAGWRWRLHSEPGQFVAGDIVGAGESDVGPWVFLGDVAGKGAAAGMLMACIQAHLSCDLGRGLPLRECVDRVNAYVIRHRGGAEFATLMAARLAPDGSSVELVDAGHGLAAVQPGQGVAKLVQADGGPPLGVADVPYDSTHIQLGSDDRLLMFSDGLNEQRGPDGNDLGIERVVSTLRVDGDVDLDVESLVALLRAHAAGLPYTDDVSLISLTFDGISDATAS
jgi:serine phosphatase RsbU (regulator of sigma subunit)